MGPALRCAFVPWHRFAVQVLLLGGGAALWVWAAGTLAGGPFVWLPYVPFVAQVILYVRWSSAALEADRTRGGSPAPVSDVAGRRRPDRG